MTALKLGFVGGGVMAEAMIAGILRDAITSPDDITVADISDVRRTHMVTQYGVHATHDAVEAILDADMIVIAVKPYNVNEATGDLRGNLQPSQVVVSIAAGVALGTLTGRLDHAAVIRVMPNTPAQIGQGISAWTATDQVTDEQHDLARRILTALGHEVYVENEEYLDMVTAVSGSGPAYVFLMMESMIDAAVSIGLDRPLAAQLVYQTVAGSALFAAQSGRHPADLRNMVTSPGGTTAAALASLERHGIRAAFADAIEAAHRRSLELGD